MQAATTSRIAANDYGRGIGIFLVVLGHVLIGLDDHGILSESATPGALTWSRGAVKWIYAFHMPLFFFLSGTLAERSVRKPFGEVLSSRLRTMAWPYVIWSLFQESLRELAGISQGSAHDWWRILYKPMMQFWFLYVLFFLSLAYYGLRRAGMTRLRVLLIALLLHYAHLYTDLPDAIADFRWVYHEFCKHGLYLAAGAVFTRGLERFRIPFFASPPGVRLLAASAGYAVIAACVALDWEKEPTLLAFIGIGASLCLASVLATHRIVPFVEQWGLLSLQIYVAHTIVSAAMRSLLLHARIYEPLVHVVAQTAAGIYGPIALSLLCQRLRCEWVFALPRKSPEPPA